MPCHDPKHTRELTDEEKAAQKKIQEFFADLPPFRPTLFAPPVRLPGEMHYITVKGKVSV